MILRPSSSMVTSSVTVSPPAADGSTGNLGHLEVLQVHPISRHPCRSQRGLHDVHERARAADVVLGVAASARNEGFDVRRSHEATFVVEMMVHDEAVRMRIVQGRQRLVEDHRVTAAVGVEQPGVARTRISALTAAARTPA